MLEKRLLSFKYAFQGIYTLLRTQRNAQIHVFTTILVLCLSFYLQLSNSEWCFIILCITSVFSAEAFNTSIEYLTDLVSPEYHPLAGKVKDIAAAAVLCSAIGAAIIGSIIFFPKIVKLILLSL